MATPCLVLPTSASCPQLVPCPLPPPLQVPAMATFTPKWQYLKRGRHLQPAFFTEHPTWESSMYYAGLVGKLEGLLQQCQPLDPAIRDERWTVGSFTRGPLPPHPNDPDLPTPCYVVMGIKRWLATEDGEDFRLQPHGATAHKPRCPNRGYMHVKAGGMHDNDFDFALHRLLCHLYHGPPPSPHHVVHHKCHHKLCLCPWHMEWCTQGDNVQAAWDHAKQRDYAPPG